MRNDPIALKLWACGLVLACGLLVGGCSGFPPFNERPVLARAPAPPGILSAEHADLPPCPQPLIAQAQWLARNMARVRLGYNKLQVVSVLGDPATSETFSLTNGAAVEVLFYHTPETICRVGPHGEGLMPLVFQDDRLLGYGQNYYKQFIVPSMRPMAVQAPVGAANGIGDGLPQARVPLSPGPNLAASPGRTGRFMQEDLPAPATPPATIYAPTPVTRGGNGYTAPMTYDGGSSNSSSNGAYSPVNYGGGAYDDGNNVVGRGVPIQ